MNFVVNNNVKIPVQISSKEEDSCASCANCKCKNNDGFDTNDIPKAKDNNTSAPKD